MSSGLVSVRLLVLLTLGAVCVLALGAGVAMAEPPKLISYGQFNSHTQFPLGVAVDKSSNDVYAAGGFFGGHLSKFDASGALLSPPSPFGGGVNSGAAVNPTNGDLYVLSNVFSFLGAPVIDTYDPNSGALVGSPFPVAESNNFGGGATIVQIAADSAGNVYVPVVPQNEVLEYSSTGTLLNTFTGGPGSGSLKGPTGVAVDASGNVWVADAGDNRVEELSPADAPVGEVRSEGIEALAPDGHGDVFALVRNKADFCGEVQPPCQHLVEYDSKGVQVADVGAGSFGSQRGGVLPSMVAVNESNGRVYVTDAFKELVWIFGPPTAPVIGRELTSEVTASEAKLGALVNPGGIPTSYRFEYGTSSAYGQSTPFPEGSVGEGLVSHTVWGAASGLVPGTTYHYRVVASNDLGTVYGTDRTFTTLTAAQAACANGELRGGFSVRLPDCRAYELVTAPPRNSSQPWSTGPAAAGGEAFAFFTQEPLPGSPTGGTNYLVTRNGAGWSEEDVIPLESYSGILCSSEGSRVVVYSAELSKAVIEYGKDTRASHGGEGTGENHAGCNTEGLQVVQGEPINYENLLVRDNATGTFRLVNAPPAGVTPADAHFKGASSDLSHVFFGEMAPLTAGAPYGVENLYEWAEGALRLLTVLPDGSLVTGSLAEGQEAQTGRQGISVDGSHVLFTSSGGLYDRIDGQRTVQVDEAQGGSGPSGGGSLQTASSDGSVVLFLDASRLTSDSTAQTGEPDLYECVLPEGSSKCELSDLTVAQAGEHADVLRASGLGSGNSSHVYFIAKGVLAPNRREYEYTDAEGKNHTAIEEAKGGENNLYLEQDGTVTFIAALSGNEFGTGAVSPDGRWFAFDSAKSLTGYENKVGQSTSREIFLYSAATGRLECASCEPSGEPPSAGGANVPPFATRPLADGGVFFETDEALVPSDTNGRMDLYEYEDGQPFLISTGTSTNEFGVGGSLFAGASETGGDVFFRATQQLVPQDANESANVVYDARVDGGFAAIASPPACTTADACRSAVSPQPSIFGSPSSQTFSGVGNLAPSVQAKVKSKAKPKRRACRGLRNKHKRAICEAKRRKPNKHKAVKSNRRGK